MQQEEEKITPNSMAHKRLVMEQLKLEAERYLERKEMQFKLMKKMESYTGRDKEMAQERLDSLIIEANDINERIDKLYGFIFKNEGHILIGSIRQEDGTYKDTPAYLYA